MAFDIGAWETQYMRLHFRSRKEKRMGKPHELNEQEKAEVVAIEQLGNDFVNYLKRSPKSENMSIAIARAELAIVWAVRAITEGKPNATTNGA